MCTISPWPLKEARTLLNERIKVFYLSSGFFEDEILMMRNTYYNLRGTAFRLVDRKRHRERSTPVFVVGSGPSLDRDIAAIKKWRDRAIVFSCGTAIGILLKNGIRPDLHVENENTFPLVKNLREFKRRYGFDGIRLVRDDDGAARGIGAFRLPLALFPLAAELHLADRRHPNPCRSPSRWCPTRLAR